MDVQGPEPGCPCTSGCQGGDTRAWGRPENGGRERAAHEADPGFPGCHGTLSSLGGVDPAPFLAPTLSTRQEGPPQAPSPSLWEGGSACPHAQPAGQYGCARALGGPSLHLGGQGAALGWHGALEGAGQEACAWEQLLAMCPGHAGQQVLGLAPAQAIRATHAAWGCGGGERTAISKS